MEILEEHHPLRPFLPPEARLLMLGSFPPPRQRWSMDFYYPNFINDMWRVMGLVFFNERDHFVDVANKRFRQGDIEHFLQDKGIALFDAAVVVRRLQANASDKFLEIVEPTDIQSLLSQLPRCGTIVSTGEKSVETVCGQLNAPHIPRVGSSVSVGVGDRLVQLYRMPSTSRAYPLKLEKKAEAYRSMFVALEML